MAKKIKFGHSAEELRESRASSSTKYCEYAVHKDKTFGTYLLKIALFLLPIICVIGLIILLNQILGSGASAIIGVAGGLIFGSIGIYFIWYLRRFSEIEYEYILCDGQMEMVKIYGGVKRKILFREKILDMDIIAPANGEWAQQYHEYLDESKYDKVFRCCTSMQTTDLYFASFTHEKLGKTLVYFNGIKKSVDIFRYHSTKTVVKPGIL